MDSTERKLAKKGRKLAKFARKHGLTYVHIGVMAPDERCDKWFVDVTAHRADGKRISHIDFLGEGEGDD